MITTTYKELSQLTSECWKDEKEELENKINKNLNKTELQEILNGAEILMDLLKNRISEINEPITVIQAKVKLNKVGNTKYINFRVERKLKRSDIKNNFKYEYMEHDEADEENFEDDILERKSIKYKKSDKSTSKEIINFYNECLNKYNIDNIEEFKKEFEELEIV